MGLFCVVQSLLMFDLRSANALDLCGGGGKTTAFAFFFPLDPYLFRGAPRLGGAAAAALFGACAAPTDVLREASLFDYSEGSGPPAADPMPSRPRPTHRF